MLSDVLKTTAAAEETIGRYVEGLLMTSEQPVQKPAWQRAPGEPLRPCISKATEAGGGGCSPKPPVGLIPPPHSVGNMETRNILVHHTYVRFPPGRNLSIKWDPSVTIT